MIGVNAHVLIFKVLGFDKMELIHSFTNKIVTDVSIAELSGRVC